MASIPDRVRELLQQPNFAHVSTLRKDGSVHGVVVWIDIDGDDILLNSADGRAWVRNLDRDPRLTITVANGENPYEFAEIRGRVREKTTEDAFDHIDRLAKKYIGQDKYPYHQPGDVRVKFFVDADSAKIHGG